VRTIIDLLFWWVVEPSDDAPHASVWIGVVLGLVFLGMTALFLEWVMNPYVRRVKWRSRGNPAGLVGLYLGAGAALGLASAFLFPRPVVHPLGLRSAWLLATPLLVGMITSTVAYLRGRERSPSPPLMFWCGVALAIGLVGTRLAFLLAA
jgi:hypothetical protein